MEYQYLQPKKRSKVRVFLGKTYYTQRRKMTWLSSNYAKTYESKPLEHSIFKHQTPLYRQLKDVDMYLQEQKVENLKIATQTINNIILKPGETFSYWKCIGKPTKSKGYKAGMVLHYGSFKTGIGGGLCQLSNLIFWMVLHSPLTITERHRHSFDVFPDAKRTQPFGSGATCVYNYRDLQFRNDTEETYQISLNLDDAFLKGQIKASMPSYFDYEIYEKYHEITHEYWGDYIRHNEIYKKVLHKNEVIYDEKVVENHALMMYAPYLEYEEKSSHRKDLS